MAVIALNNPPWTDGGHMLLQKCPFHGFRAVLIRALNKLMRAKFQVFLQQQTIGEKLVTTVEISFVFFWIY